MEIWKFVQENVFLIAIAFVSGGMLLWPAVRRSAGGPAVDTLGATLLINKDDALVLDVRQPAEVAAGKIVNSRNIPLGDLDARVKDLDKWKSKPVIVVCATGNRSGSAVGVLKKHGFEKVFNLSGGYGAWQQAGLPVEK
ncbi:MAG: rhodanese-like domain-containing protein [Burkholderiales bacterium]|jgi:rhodanese-related sulfurtransferase|nr:rhodanese-like domain-containing protein [Burkholderiales bacterium]